MLIVKGEKMVKKTKGTKKVASRRTAKTKTPKTKTTKTRSEIKAEVKSKEPKRRSVEKEKIGKRDVVENESNVMQGIIWLIVILIIVAVGIFAYYSKHPSVNQSNNAKNVSLNTTSLSPSKMNVYVFGDYQCPFTRKERSVFEKLLTDPKYKNKINLIFMQFPLRNLHKYAYEAAIAGECAKMQGKLTDYSIALLKADDLSVSGLKKVAKELGLNMKEFDTCLDTNETASEVNQDIKIGTSLGIHGTPTFVFMSTVIPGAISYDKLTPLLDKALASFNGTNPSLKPVSYPAYFIEAKNCSYCNNDRMYYMSKSTFASANFTRVEASSPEGKKLIKELNISLLPAVIVGKAFKNTYLWKSSPNIAAYFRDEGDWLVLSPKVTGASYYVNATKRLEFEERGKKILNVTGTKPQVDYFVMAFCPYGNIAEDLLYKNFELFGNKVKFVPRYIVSTTNGINFSSLHGPQELHEDVRELCVYHLYNSSVFWNFVEGVNKECNPQNADTCWLKVANSTGVNPSLIEKCYKANFTTYLNKEFKLTEEMGVTGSPTLFINGMRYGGDRTSEAYKQAICNAFKVKPSECNTSLSSSTPTAQGSCGQ